MKWLAQAQIAVVTWLLVLALSPLPSGVAVAVAASEPDEQLVGVEQTLELSEPAAAVPDGVASAMSIVSVPNDAPARTLSGFDYVGPLWGHVALDEFFSPSLERLMPYLIYFPPGYDSGTQRYPALYMLHGNSGSYEEWAAYGLLDWADDLIEQAEIEPLVIVLPQGDYSYWVNLADDGPAYGDYLAGDLVEHIDTTYRVRPGAEHRAVGGLSMGGTGALVNAFTQPGAFGVVGAHSPALPVEGARPFLGHGEQFARCDPISLAESQSALADLEIWIDVGDEDPWLNRVGELHAALTRPQIDHEFYVFPGEHWGGYWEEHVPDYLRFYDAALRANAS